MKSSCRSISYSFSVTLSIPILVHATDFFFSFDGLDILLLWYKIKVKEHLKLKSIKWYNYEQLCENNLKWQTHV